MGFMKVVRRFGPSWARAAPETEVASRKLVVMRDFMMIAEILYHSQRQRELEG
jgi:hypothetical protein